MTTVYKVVRKRRDGKLVSAVMKHPKLRVIYEPHQASVAPNGLKLLAFSERGDAAHFSGSCTASVELWEAEGDNVSPRLEICYWWEGLRVIKRLWAGKLPHSWRMRAPPSTVACDSITLVKRIDPPEDK